METLNPNELAALAAILEEVIERMEARDGQREVGYHLAVALHSVAWNARGMDAAEFSHRVTDKRPGAAALMGYDWAAADAALLGLWRKVNDGQNQRRS